MAIRYDEFAPGEIYHLCTRGVDKRSIVEDKADYERMSALMRHCLPQGRILSYSLRKRSKEDIEIPLEGKGLVDLLAFCVMTNHLHLLIKENVDKGTSTYMQRLLNGYAKYFNMRYNRSGPLFTSRFKNVLVDDDEQLLHVSRYIHLNPYVAHMIDDPFDYPWSSLRTYVAKRDQSICHRSLIRSMMGSGEYREFIKDEADYERSLEDYEYVFLDYEV